MWAHLDTPTNRPEEFFSLFSLTRSSRGEGENSWWWYQDALFIETERESI